MALVFEGGGKLDEAGGAVGGSIGIGVEGWRSGEFVRLDVWRRRRGSCDEFGQVGVGDFDGNGVALGAGAGEGGEGFGANLLESGLGRRAQEIHVAGIGPPDDANGEDEKGNNDVERDSHA